MSMRRGPRIVVGGIASLIFGMVLLATGANRVLRGRTPDPNAGTLLLAAVALSVLFVVLGIGGVIYGQALRRYESLIAAIVRGDTSTARLADEQPSKRASNPSLPFSVDLRPDSRRVATYVLIVLAGLEVVLFIAAVVGLRGSLREAAHYILISSIAQLLFIVPLTCALFIIGAHQRITLKADSLIVRLAMSYQDQQAMAWDDAQVFTISPPGKVGSPPLRYELVGRRCSVRWVRAQQRLPFRPLDALTATKPIIPFEEYDRQMDALLGLVAEKTGLPLYDLRDVG